VIVIVMPGVAGLVRIKVIIGEQAGGLSPVGLDDDLSLLPNLADPVVPVHQDDIKSRSGPAHGPGLWIHPGVVGYADHSLSLAVALHEPQACGLEEALVDGRIERLACGDGVLEPGEVESGHVAFDHEPEYGGRGAECGDPVPAHLVHHPSGIEAVVVVDEDRRAGYPLPVYLAPGALGPAGIGHCVVQAIVLHILPVLGCEDMGQGICLVVLDHLGVAGGAGGEVGEDYIIILSGPLPPGPGEVR